MRNVAVAAGLALAAACGSSPLGPGHVVVDDSLTATIARAFTDEFDVAVPIPAIYNDTRAVNCSGGFHISATAYLNRQGKTSDLFALYLSRDGSQVTWREQSRVVTPAGTFRALLMVLDHPETVDDQAIAALQAATERINQDHAAYAASRGFSSPIVSFQSTVVRTDPDDILSPSVPAQISFAASREGLITSEYDFLMSVNMDPAQREGGFATVASGVNFIYMGNFESWTTPLSAEDWDIVAGALFHHEVGHHWGWPGTHDWSPRCGNVRLGFEPLIAAPVLFGWEDVDGDGVPEILDATPYGRE